MIILTSLSLFVLFLGTIALSPSRLFRSPRVLTTVVNRSPSLRNLIKLVILSMALNAFLINGMVFLFPEALRLMGMKVLLGLTLLLTCLSGGTLVRRLHRLPTQRRSGASQTVNGKKEAGQNNSTYWLSEEQAREIRQKVDRYLLEERGFLNRKFRVSDLAKAVGVSRHQLAACFTQAYDANFNEVINRRRVEYGLQEVDPEKWDQYTVEGMAYHLGFGSRATFNSAFKKVTGLTPARYHQIRNQPGRDQYPHDYAEAPRSLSTSRR